MDMSLFPIIMMFWPVPSLDRALAMRDPRGVPGVGLFAAPRFGAMARVVFCAPPGHCPRLLSCLRVPAWDPLASRFFPRLGSAVCTRGSRLGPLWSFPRLGLATCTLLIAWVRLAPRLGSARAIACPCPCPRCSSPTSQCPAWARFACASPPGTHLRHGSSPAWGRPCACAGSRLGPLWSFPRLGLAACTLFACSRLVPRLGSARAIACPCPCPRCSSPTSSALCCFPPAWALSSSLTWRSTIL